MSAEAERTTEVIPEWKREEVDAIVDLLETYESVGVVNIAGIPSRQLQNMRREIHGAAELRVSRNTLLVRALEELDEGFTDLVPYVEGQVGLIATNDNPFGLYRELESSKTPAPINAGEVAPNDVVIPEGDTGIDPGPFVGELQQVGANARIDEGSIKVLEDSTVLEEGEEVSNDLANVLVELGIEPKEVGLDLRAVFADGVLFEPEELELDVEQYAADVRAAASGAWNLSINAEYSTAGNASTLLQTASGEAKNLAIHASIEDPDVVPDLVREADAQLRTLAGQIEDTEALPDELQDVAETETESDDEETDQDDAESEVEDADADDANADDANADDTDADTDEADAGDDETAGDDDDDEDAGDALGAMF